MARKSNSKSVSAETKVEEVVENVPQEVTEVAEVTSDSTLAALVQNLQESVEKAETEQVAETPAKPTAKVEKNQGVGQFVRKLIAQGMSNKDILKEVHDAYGNTQTTYACVAWYRNKMKKANQQAKTTGAVETVQEFLNKEAIEAAEDQPSTEVQ